jgi:hypothetical protein
MGMNEAAAIADMGIIITGDRITAHTRIPMGITTTRPPS